MKPPTEKEEAFLKQHEELHAEYQDIMKSRDTVNAKMDYIVNPIFLEWINERDSD